MSGKTMIEKRMVDAHLENFNFETMTVKEHHEWITKLHQLLMEYRNVRDD